MVYHATVSTPSLPEVGAWGNLDTLSSEEGNMGSIISGRAARFLQKVNPLDHEGRILMGAYPAAPDPAISSCMMKALIKDLGVQTFICLQPEDELKRLSPYNRTAIRIANEHDLPKPIFVHFPIDMCGVNDDNLVQGFMERELLPMVNKNDTGRVYIHCMGGNGRTGTISALALAYLYDLDAETALKKVGDYHDRFRQRVVSYAPEAPSQFEQVRRLTPLIKHSDEAKEEEGALIHPSSSADALQNDLEELKLEVCQSITQEEIAKLIGSES